MPAADVVTAQVAAEREGRTLFVLPRAIDGTPAFFAAVSATMPLDPPFVGPPQRRYVWEAPDDSLWEGLLQLQREADRNRVAGQFAVCCTRSGRLRSGVSDT
jgi:hypothetical protein